MSQDTQELIKEWDELKRRAFGVLISAIVIVAGYGIWVGSIQSDITQLKKDTDSSKQEASLIQSRINAVEVTNSEIRARLSSIDATLQEIKTEIKQLK